MAIYRGTPGPDIILGTLTADVVYDIGQGVDVVTTLDGDDTVYVTPDGGAALSIVSTVAMGFGDDLLVIDGRGQSAPVVVARPTLDLSGIGLNGAVSLGGTQRLVYTGVDRFQVYGGSGDDTLTLGAGDDMLVGGPGADLMTGGAGNDAYEVTEAGDRVVENPGEGTDTVYSYLPDYTLPANVERLELAGAAVTGRGNALDNTLVGTSGSNVLIGGSGNDTMIGGGGNDAYEVTDAGDVAVEAPGGGTDTVYSYLADYTLPANVERLELAGSAAAGRGNALDNTLMGNGGSNLLIGGGGADIMIGGGGNDAYEVTEAGDQVVETAGGGYDTVYAYLADYTLPANVERLELAGGAVVGRGNALDNVLVGTAGANILIGGAGADDMYGGGGDDAYEVADAGDTVVETAGGGVDTVYSYLPAYALPANVERLELVGASVTGNGNALDNTLVGNTGANFLNGGGGDDVMTGFLGVDTFYWLGANAGRDTITDFDAGLGETVNLSPAQFADFAAVLAAARQVGSDVVITLDAADTLTLQNVLIGQLGPANFTFYPGPF